MHGMHGMPSCAGRRRAPQSDWTSRALGSAGILPTLPPCTGDFNAEWSSFKAAERRTPGGHREDHRRHRSRSRGVCDALAPQGTRSRQTNQRSNGQQVSGRERRRSLGGGYAQRVRLRELGQLPPMARTWGPGAKGRARIDHSLLSGDRARRRSAVVLPRRERPSQAVRGESVPSVQLGTG
jgi:hypothetical protein